MKTILAALLLLQAASLDEFYKFKAGTAWTYKRVEDGAERKITGVVTGDDQGKVRLDWKDPDKGGNAIVTWSVIDGILTVESAKEGGGTEITFAVLKEGSKKGDKWASGGGEVVHQGKADVTVPAGTYKETTWTQLRIGEEGNEVKVDFYLAPKVGLVKVDVKTKDGGPNTFELSEFKEAKK